MRYVDELTDAVRSQLALAYGIKDQLGSALRARLREGYGLADLRADARAGLAVALLALPLSMALARTTGVAPQHGLYTAIIAGIVVSLLGGSRMQVTGPTAAFVVILEPIVARHGLGGLLVAGVMAGCILVLMGVARLGKLMQFIPHPVTTGFTTGIAVVLVVLASRDALGLELAGRPSGTIEFIGAVWDARAGARAGDALVFAATLALLVGLPRLHRRIPAPLVALAAVAAIGVVAGHLVDGFAPRTIGSTFATVIDGEHVRGVPPLPPLPVWPWRLGDATGSAFPIDYALVRELLPAAFAIAMLGAIEALMSAVIADGMAGTKHDPNAELIALGIGNIVCPFFGGIACTGALARTGTNVRAGARSPLAAVFQALVVLAATIALAPLMAYLPLAALAALVLVFAGNMGELRHFGRLMRIAPRSDVLVLVTCFALTVLVDMAVAVSVGVMLAALLFMRRMAALTKITLDTSVAERLAMPPGIRLYEIAGPMFFGAANRAMETLDAVGTDAKVVILSMKGVDVMDATGLIALESTLDRLGRGGRMVILTGLAPEPAALLERAGIKRVPDRLAVAPDLDTAVSMAIVHTARAT
jgi:SulP family sulfate permease